MSKLEIFLRRLWLFVRIVWRIDQTEHRLAASTAWEVVRIVWPFEVGKMSGEEYIDSLRGGHTRVEQAETPRLGTSKRTEDMAGNQSGPR